jgi:hypothetical protein
MAGAAKLREGRGFNQVSTPRQELAISLKRQQSTIVKAKKTTQANTDKENKMKMGHRQINHPIKTKMRLPLTLKKPPIAPQPGRRIPGAQGTDLGPERERRGKKIPWLVHKLLITIYLPKNEAKRT